MSLPESSTVHKASVEAQLDEEQEEIQGGGSEEQVELDETGEADYTTGGSASKKRKERMELIREPGRSLLPASRVLKIIKADEASTRQCILHKIYLTRIRICVSSRRRHSFSFPSPRNSS
jgi:hypothetical protein